MMHADGRTEGQPACWISYKVHAPYDADMSHQCCIICIVLEAGIGNAFSGIRLIVVNEDSDLGMENFLCASVAHAVTVSPTCSSLSRTDQ